MPWARILLAILRPGSCSAPPPTVPCRPCRFIRERWQSRGVPVHRITFEPFVSLEALHAAYEDVDIALDPFPFNGGVTTCDALAHGVPVVALEGDRMVSRQGCALLRAANRAEWIARDRDAYVSLAVALADPRAFEAQRAELAAEFPRTPLCDAIAFTHALESAYAALAVAPPAPGHQSSLPRPVPEVTPL